MYDELVERLRYCAVSDNQCSECKYRFGSPDGSKMCLDLLMVDAADAIEELSKQNEKGEAVVKTALDFIPCWVPVTERLPESMHEYVLCCGEKGGQFVGWIVMGMLVNGKARAFQHGGKGRYITHWMPLPPAPEPTEDDAPSGPYDLLYEEGGANTT